MFCCCRAASVSADHHPDSLSIPVAFMKQGRVNFPRYFPCHVLHPCSFPTPTVHSNCRRISSFCVSSEAPCSYKKFRKYTDPCSQPTAAPRVGRESREEHKSVERHWTEPRAAANILGDVTGTQGRRYESLLSGLYGYFTSVQVSTQSNHP